MSFTLLLAVTAAVAASMGYLAARRGEEEDDELEGDFSHPSDKKDQAGSARRAPDEKGPKVSPFEGLPLSLGDVVLVENEERWLAGAAVMREQKRVVAALFLAPEGSKQTSVAVFAPPRKDIFWMSPVTLDAPEEPPTTIELGGVVLRRKGRLPVSVERLGQGTPPLAEEAIWGTYEGGQGEVAVVIVSQGRTFAWKGRRLEEGEYDRLGEG